MCLTQFSGPASRQKTQAASVFDLRFLAGGFANQRHGLGRRVGGLKVTQSFAEQPVQFEAGSRKRRVKFSDNRGNCGFVGISETMQNDLRKADVCQALFRGQ